MSGAGLFTTDLIKLAGSAANGLLVVSAFDPNDKSQIVQQFVGEFKAKYSDAVPSKFVAHTYDAVMMIADAIQRAGSADGPKVRDALAATNGYNGVIGKVTFDKNREVVLDLQRLMVANKEFVPWKKS